MQKKVTLAPLPIKLPGRARIPKPGRLEALNHVCWEGNGEGELEKSRRSKSQKNRKQTLLNPVVEEDLPFGCADPSRFVRLEDIAPIEKGLTPIQSARSGEFPLVTTAEKKSLCDHFDFDGRAAIIPMVSSTGHGNATLNRLHYHEGRFALGTILCAVFPFKEEIFFSSFHFRISERFQRGAAGFANDGYS